MATGIGRTLTTAALKKPATGVDPALPAGSAYAGVFGNEPSSPLPPQPISFAPTSPGAVSGPTPFAKPTTTPALSPIEFIRDYQNKNAASPAAVQALFSQLQQQYGINPYSYNGTASGNEIDWNGKRKVYSEGGNSWYDPDGLSDDGGGAAPTQQAAVSPVATTTSYGVPASSAKTSSPYDASLQKAIMSLLDTPQTVDSQSLVNSPENDAFRLSQQRSQERDQAQLAEQASFEGWSDTGGEETARQGLRQQRGDAESQFVGQLAVSKMQENKDRLLAGIQAAMSAGQFQQAQELQLKLANLDAAIRRETLSQQGSQFDKGLGYQYTALNENANQAATRTLLGL